MCGRYLLTTPVDALGQLFRFMERPNLGPRYNIAPTQDVPIVRLTRAGDGASCAWCAGAWCPTGRTT